MTTDLEGAVELDEAHRALTAASRQLPELWEQPNKAAVGVVVKPQHLRLILAALKAARHDYHTKTREADDALASITRERDAMRTALAGFGDDYQTSDRHHPNHVLIPTLVFERVRAAALVNGEGE